MGTIVVHMHIDASARLFERSAHVVVFIIGQYVNSSGNIIAQIRIKVDEITQWLAILIDMTINKSGIASRSQDKCARGSRLLIFPVTNLTQQF